MMLLVLLNGAVALLCGVIGATHILMDNVPVGLAYIGFGCGYAGLAAA